MKTRQPDVFLFKEKTFFVAGNCANQDKPQGGRKLNYRSIISNECGLAKFLKIESKSCVNGGEFKKLASIFFKSKKALIAIKSNRF